MPNDPLAPVFAGQPIRISAAAWNEIVAAARGRRQPPRPNQPVAAGRQFGVVECLALNSTGAALVECKPAAVTAAGGATLTGPEGFAWQDSPLLTLGVPAAVTDFIVITLEAIPDGSIGRVAIAGAVLCDVQVTTGSERYAAPIAGSTAKLLAGATGTVRLLHAPTAGSSVRCVVGLGDQIAGGAGLGTRNADGTQVGTTTTLEFDQSTGLRIDQDGGGPGIDRAKVAGLPLSALATIPTDRVIGNVSGAPAVPAALTGAQVTPLLSVMVASGGGHAKGLVPTPGAVAGTTRVLHEDGIWRVPATGGGIPVTQQTFPLAGVYSIVAGTGVWVNVPGASLGVAPGNYLIWYSVRGAVNGTQASWISARLNVGGIVIAGSELIVVQCNANVREVGHHSQHVGPVSVGVGMTIDVQVKRDNAGGGAYTASDLFGDGNGQCTLLVAKLP